MEAQGITKMSTSIIIAVIIAAVFALMIVSLYNSLINNKNMVENAFAGIDVQLTKRYDLIPNLVSTVQKYMKHERETLTEITAMRARAVSGNLSDNEKVALDNQISTALSGIMIAVENYPDLKASQNFLQLQASLNEVEEQLSAARRTFNAMVTEYNNSVQMFPSNIMASYMNLEERTWFEAPEVKKGDINVKELFDN